MDSSELTSWLTAMRETIVSYRRMIDATVEQLTDSELSARPAPDINSVGIILRHLGGNLQSRWTNFLTTDGEKPNRDRDSEFLDWQGDRQSLLEYFDRGWMALENALDTIGKSTVSQTIYIRGEAHSVPHALTRSVTHLTYHVGQIAMIARMVHSGDWHWLTIAPGSSTEHNGRTWGTAESRSIFAESKDAK